MMLDSKSRKKYLTISPVDLVWGLAVNSVGRQNVAENEVYPPQGHPTRYLFNTLKGRVLNEYQLLYITKGKGVFKSKSGGEVPVKEGTMFLLFPGEWHTYQPDTDTGWNEYWIGFDGKIIDEWVRNGFFSKESPVFNVGLNEEMISLYKRAIIIADAQEANYQQALSGIACNLLSMALYLSRNTDFKSSNIAENINVAKAAVQENISSITPEELARLACMSYSKFRKVFKEYTGFAPAQYIQEVRINMAKEILTNTSQSIKEIAFELGYENRDYFFTVFRKVTGMTPVNYRRLTRGEDV
jgi:AraC-like DNA-binding protein